MKTVAILGSTGSIGQNSLEVLGSLSDRFRVSFLATHKNIDLLRQQVERFRPRNVAVLNHDAALSFKSMMNGSVKVAVGEEGLQDLIDQDESDVVISSLVGFAGLKPTIRAIEKGKTVALANKETLVVAGEMIMNLVKKHRTTLIPIDSEHSAILQCMVGEDVNDISKLVLTASGGPFLHLAKDEFKNVTVERALNHPNWKMGNKITIDSATLMNKGLEVIEAHWLFNLPPERIEVVIHPQSIIHSMVEFVDGSVKAQLGVPDMKLPIQYSLTHPARVASNYQRIDFNDLREMTFLKPDLAKFECLALAYRALEQGGTAPAILNAANEIAVGAFLSKKIRFDHIPRLIGMALSAVSASTSSELENIVAADTAARRFVEDRTITMN